MQITSDYAAVSIVPHVNIFTQQHFMVLLCDAQSIQ